MSHTFSDLIIIVVHIAPKTAFHEIHHLDKVRAWASKHFKSTQSDSEINILLLGDLNASRPYIKDWQGNALRDPTKYRWLIEDHEDTTVMKTMAAYDRCDLTTTLGYEIRLNFQGITYLLKKDK